MHQPLAYTKYKKHPLPFIKHSAYSKYVIWLVIIVSVFRLTAAQLFPLGNDESYYWLYAQQMQWNYYDHPPMVAVWVRIFTLNLLLENYELFIRLGSILSCAFATWFMYKAVCRLHSERAGWLAAVLYNTAFYPGIIAGVFIMPDSPQMLFWTLSLWMLARIKYNSGNIWSWVIFGISTGLCIMSKIHGVFIWIGVIAYICFVRREWLRCTKMYLALLLSIIVVLPFILWNVQNDFATYRLHGKRVLVHEGTLNFSYFLSEVTGQLLYNNPVNVMLIVIALFAVFKTRPYLKKLSLYIFIGLPIILLLLIISLSKPVFAHWSGPGYVSLIPIAAVYLDSLVSKRAAARWIKITLTSLVLFYMGWIALIHFYPGTFGSKIPSQFGKGDVTLDRWGWDRAGEEFSKFYNDQLQEGKINRNTPMVCNKWWGAHVEYYFCRADKIPMIGLGAIQQIGQFGWLNKTRVPQVDMDTALCIVPSDEYFDVHAAFSGYFKNITAVDTITQYRSGELARYFYVYRLYGWRSAK